MKSVIFGNRDWWKLSLDDVSVPEQVVALGGELSAGFIRAVTPMRVNPSALARFAAEVREVDRTLTGLATLESMNQQSALRLQLAVDHVGHVDVTGRYEINGNSLDFGFRSDQTQLAPLASWLEDVVRAYERKTVSRSG